MDKKYINHLVTFIIINPLFILLNLLLDSKFFILYTIYIIFVLFNIGFIKINKKCIVLYIFLLIYSIISIFNYNDLIYNWIGMIYLLFIYSYPWAIITSKIYNWKEVLQKIYKKMNVLLITNSILFLYSIIINKKMIGNMELSYTILPFTIFSLYYYWKYKKIKFLLYFIISFIIIVVFGSRGPILCIFIFVIFYLLLYYKKKYKTIILLIIAFIIVFFNFNKILNYAIDTLHDFGLASRTLDKIQTNTIYNDTGRGKIQEVVKEDISKHWLTGSGIGGERPLLHSKIYSGSKPVNSCYAHNFFIEIFSNYGIIIGSIVLYYLLINIIIMLKKSSIYKKEMFILLISMEFIRLLLSSSYTRSPIFFIIIGLLFSKDEGDKHENINYCTK